jgi:hypothetical protein
MTILECGFTNVDLLGEAPPKLVAISYFDLECGYFSIGVEVVTFLNGVVDFTLAR